MIKLIASDFDGTLFPFSMDLGAAPGVSERTVAAISAFRSAGGRFILSTGRMFRAVRPYALSLGLNDEIIAYQGAGIFDIVSGRCLRQVLMEPELAAEFLKTVEGSAFCHAYHGNEFFIERLNPYSEGYSRYTGVPYSVAGMQLSEFVIKNNMPLYKVYCAVSLEARHYLMDLCREKFKGRLLISASKDTNMEAVDIKTSKGEALEWLMARYGLKKEEVMAFGDGLNDLEMLDAAGIGVAVGDADPALKEHADMIAEDCTDDGVAKVIERLIANGMEL
ncbi:MAG: Cof-type HAD-IIB family hydrolase [Christensenellales bacterium]|jgi:Cof subfamily protein (haloacid dehalogenase superfamily)